MESHSHTINKSYAQQRAVMEESLRIFHDRSHVRGDLWARHEPLSQLRMIREKLDRIDAAMSMSLDPTRRAAALDDAQDIINFAAFFIRLMKGETPDA